MGKAIHVFSSRMPSTSGKSRRFPTLRSHNLSWITTEVNLTKNSLSRSYLSEISTHMHRYICMLYIERCPPQNPYVEALTPNVMYRHRQSFQKAVKLRWGHEGWGPHITLVFLSNKTGTIPTPHFSFWLCLALSLITWRHSKKAAGWKPTRKVIFTNLPPSLQNLWHLNVSCVSHKSMGFCYHSPSWWRQCTKMFTEELILKRRKL